MLYTYQNETQQTVCTFSGKVTFGKWQTGKWLILCEKCEGIGGHCAILPRWYAVTSHCSKSYSVFAFVLGDYRLVFEKEKKNLEEDID